MNSKIKPTYKEVSEGVKYLLSQVTEPSFTAGIISSLICYIIYGDDNKVTNFSDCIEATLRDWDIDSNKKSTR